MQRRGKPPAWFFAFPGQMSDGGELLYQMQGAHSRAEKDIKKWNAFKDRPRNSLKKSIHNALLWSG